MKVRLFPNLEAEIKRNGYTNEGFAKKIKILSPSSLSCRLNGKVDFSLTEMLVIAKELKKGLDYLFWDIKSNINELN